MAILYFKCSHCDCDIETTDLLAGQTMSCPECENLINIPFADISAGKIIGDFVLEKKLGVGGMGEVWLANQAVMDRMVALKILSPSLTKDADFVNRFMKEVKTAAKLEHPNIVGAFHAGQTEEGLYYLAISFVEGEELGERLKREHVLDEKEALKIIRDIAQALLYAWDTFKILHRDLKPANIMLEHTGVAKLMDMGIAKSLSSDDSSLTMTGVIVGTPNYMSPEQARGQLDIDERSDIYALGATLFELVTGQLPFNAPTPMGIITKHLTEELPRPHSINLNVSKHCDKLINIMMEKDRDNRQKSWENVISDIDDVLNNTHPASKYSKSKFSSKKVALLCGIISCIAFLAFLFFNKNRENKGNIKTQKNDVLSLIDTVIDDSNEKNDNASIDDFANSTFNVKEESLKKYNKKWAEVIDYIKENPNDTDTAIALFNDIKTQFPENSSKATIEIAKINKKIKNIAKEIQKKQTIKDLLFKLNVKAEEFSSKKMFLEASKVYSNYNDLYIEETKEIREKKKKEYLTLNKQQEEDIEQKLLAEENIKTIVGTFADKLESFLLAGEFKNAINHLNKNKSNADSLKDYHIILSQGEEVFKILDNKNKFLINYFKSNIGKNIQIDDKKGSITKVSDSKVILNTLIGTASLNMPVSYNKISENFKINLLKKNNPLAFKLESLLGFITHNKNDDNYYNVLTKLFNENNEFIILFPKTVENMRNMQKKINNDIDEMRNEQKEKEDKQDKQKRTQEANDKIIEVLKKFGCNLETENLKLRRNIINTLGGHNIDEKIIIEASEKLIIEASEKLHQFFNKYDDIKDEIDQGAREKISFVDKVIKNLLNRRDGDSRRNNKIRRNKNNNFNNDSPY